MKNQLSVESLASNHKTDMNQNNALDQIIQQQQAEIQRLSNQIAQFKEDYFQL